MNIAGFAPAIDKFISSYPDALIFDLLCRKLSVSLPPVNLPETDAKPN
jgi:hypothetical protein